MSDDATGARPEADGPVTPWTPVDPVAWRDPEPVAWHTGPPPVAARPARGPLAAVAVAIVVTLALLVGVGVVAPRFLGTGTASRALAHDSAAGSPPAAAAPGAGQVDRRSVLGALLAERGRAVTHDDVAAWRRTQVASARVPAFDRLAVLPITVWTYDVGSVDPGPGTSDVVADVRVHLRYDVDTVDAVVHERMVLRRSADGWLVVSEATADRRAQPWDLGTLTVVRGTRSLVIGIDTPRSSLRGYARLVDEAVPAVSAVWGTGWSQRAVVVVPRTVTQLGRALARTTSTLTDYAAVTTGELPAEVGGVPALRVWTNTEGMAELSALGREIVVRHELTHVATDAPGEPGVPLWLEEGFAEYVAYQDSGVSLSDELSDLVSAQRRGAGLQHLPSSSTFEGAQVDLAYEGADLACRVVADTYGQAQLVRLYRLTVAGSGTSEQNLEAALRIVTGSGTAAFEATWRARMRALAS